MMKKILLAIFVALPMLAVAQAPKFGIVNSQTLAADTPESIKERRIQEIQELDQKMQQFRATASQDLQRQQEAAFAPIQEKVRQAIDAVGKENGMTFIFENVIPVYTGTDVTDVTPLVKTRLNLK